MRILALPSVAIILSVGACALSAQSATLDAAVNALGGKARLLAVRTLVIEGRGEQLNFGQNHTPSAETRFEVTAYRMATDFAARRHLIDVTRVPRFPTANTAPQRFRLGLDGEVAYGILPNETMTRAAAQVAADRAHNVMLLPIGFIQAAYAPGTVLSEDSDRAGVRRVRIDVGGHTYAMYVDTRTNLPVRTEKLLYQPMLGDVSVVTDFSDWQDVAGIMHPMRLVQRYENLFTLSDTRLTGVRVNEDPGTLAATDSIRAIVVLPTPPAPTIVVDSVAPGVWSIAGQTHHTIAIEQSNQVVLVEAPQSDLRTLAAIERARELRPAKAVNLLINTHHHFDHSGGLRAAIAQGLTIATHEGNRDFYERVLFPRRHAVVQDALARNPRPLRLMPIGDKVVRADSLRPIELYQVPSDHSGSMLIVYLPNERLLIQADLYNPPAANAINPVFPFAKALVDNVQRRGLQVDRVVGIHGRPVPWSDVLAAASRTP